MPAPDDREPDRAADHRITVRHIADAGVRASPRWRALAVAGLEIDRGDRIGQDGGVEAEAARVERGRLDAVVGREADDDDALDARRREEALELGRDGLAGDRVAHREARVAVLAVGALADPRRVVGE